ncbi:MAG: PP2C family protein-serine/threonine phosphatase, partial [Pseudomonadota bacterium]
VNRKTGMIRFCQAGHPNPAILRNDGNVEFVGTGGAPVGLIPSMTYETDVIHLAPGERFMMFTDGITEAEAPNGDMLDEKGLTRLLTEVTSLNEQSMLEKVIDGTLKHAATDKLEDDLSALLLSMPDAA